MYRKMTYTKLMNVVEEGYAEISAWCADTTEGTLAQVGFHKANGTTKWETILVTKVPADAK